MEIMAKPMLVNTGARLLLSLKYSTPANTKKTIPDKKYRYIYLGVFIIKVPICLIHWSFIPQLINGVSAKSNKYCFLL